MEQSYRVQELLNGLRHAAGAGELRRWAQRCAHLLGLEGLAVSLRPGAELVWFSHHASARLADLQVTLGQGPVFDDNSGSWPRQATDLESGEGGRWDRFAAEATTLGVRAVFVWPVRFGDARLGTLTGHRRTPGALSTAQASHGLHVADVLAGHVLAWNPHIDRPGEGPGAMGAVGLHRIEVHQATGVLSARLGVSLDEALLRLRARAFATDRSLTDTAHTIMRELDQ
ncbi:ANTAR domain-containing protein [Streptomyces sp. NPDC047070]|uniref:ANTAR domain-containing protein n=1 Tax=Streptomyces sp. NPDC047070 TaxID=3154923 RepID=UPI0034551D50